MDPLSRYHQLFGELFQVGVVPSQNALGCYEGHRTLSPPPSGGLKVFGKRPRYLLRVEVVDLLLRDFKLLPPELERVSVSQLLDGVCQSLSAVDGVEF